MNPKEKDELRYPIVEKLLKVIRKGYGMSIYLIPSQSEYLIKAIEAFEANEGEQCPGCMGPCGQCEHPQPLDAGEMNFGDYVEIEQLRHGCKNEMYVHKVIGRGRSNGWVDVPVQSPATEVLHDEIEEVVSAICCGVMETVVRKYRIKDVKKSNYGESALSQEREKWEASITAKQKEQHIIHEELISGMGEKVLKMFDDGVDENVIDGYQMALNEVVKYLL